MYSIFLCITLLHNADIPKKCVIMADYFSYLKHEEPTLPSACSRRYEYNFN